VASARKPLDRTAVLRALRRFPDQPKEDTAWRRAADELRDKVHAESQRVQRLLDQVRAESQRVQEQLDAPKRAAQRFQAEIGELVRAFFRESRNPYVILLSPGSTSKRRHAAARRIAASLPSIRFKRPAVREALRGLSERDRYVRLLFASALLDAAKERETPGRIRLGRRWVKDSRGRRAEHVVPLDLDLPQAIRWLVQRARRLTEQAILGDDGTSGPRRRLSQHDRAALGEDHDRVEAMSEYRPTPPATLRKRRPSKQERRLYDLLRAGKTTAQAAAHLNLNPSTIRVLIYRLKKKGLKL